MIVPIIHGHFEIIRVNADDPWIPKEGESDDAASEEEQDPSDNDAPYWPASKPGWTWTNNQGKDNTGYDWHTTYDRDYRLAWSAHHSWHHGR